MNVENFFEKINRTAIKKIEENTPNEHLDTECSWMTHGSSFKHWKHIVELPVKLNEYRLFLVWDDESQVDVKRVRKYEN